MLIHDALSQADGTALMSVGPVKIEKEWPAKVAKNGNKHRSLKIQDGSGECYIRIWDDVDNTLIRDGEVVAFTAGGGSLKVNEYKGQKSLVMEGGNIDRVDGEVDEPPKKEESAQQASSPPPSKPPSQVSQPGGRKVMNITSMAKMQAYCAAESLKATEDYMDVWADQLGTDKAVELRLTLATQALSDMARCFHGEKYPRK